MNAPVLVAVAGVSGDILADALAVHARRRVMRPRTADGAMEMAAALGEGSSAPALVEVAPLDEALDEVLGKGLDAAGGGPSPFAGLPARLRAAGWRGPLIGLRPAAGNDAPDDAGALDAVIPLPARLDRALSLLEPRAPPPAARVDIGPLRLRAEAMVCETGDGRAIPLTEKEAQLLAALAAAPGRILSREALLRSVWGYADGVSTHTLETHVYRLRRKVEDDPARPRVLLTAPGGYALPS